jgi:hypothetical protein
VSVKIFRVCYTIFVKLTVSHEMVAYLKIPKYVQVLGYVSNSI